MCITERRLHCEMTISIVHLTKRKLKQMKTIILIFFTLFFIVNFSSSQIIISEYLEGAGNDKCIEIYNTTGAAINLSGYNLKFYFNGSSTAGNTINLSGTIPSCGTWVVCDDNAAASYLSAANQVNNGSFFNGDDAIGLYNGTTLLDLFGNIGHDPGSEWTGVGGGTADDGFTRNSSYCSGVTTDPAATGFPTFTGANWTSVGMSGSTLGSHTSSCGACGAPITNTINIDAISSLSFTVDCTTDATGSLDITSTDVFTAGNVYTVELSDASGNFASPVIIGTLTSTNNSATINFTIPAGTPSGSGYRVRVTSSAPAVTSPDNGSDITITLSGAPCVLEPPHMTSVIINSCNPTCPEGHNEIVFGSSGGYSIDVTTSNFNFEYGSNASPAANTNYTDVLVNNATRINELNTAAGCPGLFVDAVGTTIPPNASWMLAYTDICEEALDWTGLCGSGPIYVIFQNDPDWNTNGNFVNGSSGMRYLNTRIITTTADVFDIDYNFNSNTYANSDGVYVTYDSSGGAPILYGDDDCNLEPVVLPIELYSFTGELIHTEALLNWTTLTEYNFSHFEIYHATENFVFSQIGMQPAAGNTSTKQDYRLVHSSPLPGINYYRLIAVDNDGSERNQGIISLNYDHNFAYFKNDMIVLHAAYSVEIYNLQGKLIATSFDQNKIPFQHRGVFLIREVNSGKTQKLIIQ